jgi:opacity protein-like surface antigen
MKTFILIIAFTCINSKLFGQLYFGGSVGFTAEIPDMLSRLKTPFGLITTAEIRKLTGKFGFGLDFNQMRYNLYENSPNPDKYKAIKTITVPCKINFDYHFITDKKLSSYIGAGVGLAHIKTLEGVTINGDVFISEYSGASNSYNIRSGLLIDIKLGKLNFSFNYLHLPNLRFNPSKIKYDKLSSNIINFGVGMLFEI